MTTLLRAADQASAYTLTVSSGGTLVTPTTTPTATMFTDAARTAGAVSLTVTATAQPQVFTVTIPATAAGRRYLTHVITTSLGTRTDDDDDILFAEVGASVEGGLTALDLVNETRRHLYSGRPETLNQIAACDPTTQTVTLNRTLSNVGAGTVLSVGLEAMHVWSVIDQQAGTLEVLRGHLGSTATAHGENEIVRAAPMHTDFAIFRALNAEVAALSGAGIYRMRTLDLTSSTDGSRTYDLADDVVDVYEVYADPDVASNTWPRVSSWTWVPGLPTTEFASGGALRIDSAVPSDRPLRVRYKAALSPLTALTDDVEMVTGLRPSAHDIPALGAAWRLTAPAEVERNRSDRQGDSRRAEEVPPGAKLRSPLGLQQIRQQRISEELRLQQRLYPSRSR